MRLRTTAALPKPNLSCRYCRQVTPSCNPNGAVTVEKPSVVFIASMAALVFATCAVASAEERVDDLSYHSPGVLVPPKAGHGRIGDRKIYLENIVFPIKFKLEQAAYPNS